MKTTKLLLIMLLVVKETLVAMAATAFVNDVRWSYDIVAGGACLTGGSPVGNDLVIPPAFGSAAVVAIGDRAFMDCDQLTGVSIPDSVTSIGEQAFSRCGELTTVMIGKGVTNIASDAFSACPRLLAIQVDVNNPVYSSEDGSLVSKTASRIILWPSGKEGGYAIPSGVTSIEPYAFYGCDGLLSVTIPDSVTNIGNYAFSACGSLSSVTIPDSVTSIGDDAFSSTSLSSVTIGSGATNIDSGAFDYCSRLKAINVAADNPAYASENGVLFSSDKTTLLLFPAYRAGEYAIPNGVTGIGERAFYNCKSLTSVMIPNTVTNIGNYAFYYCTSLKAATIPDGVTDIRHAAFYGSALNSVIIGAGVTNIASSAFDQCSSLKSIAVDKNNRIYSSEDGVLLSKDKTVLFRVPSCLWGEYDIPDGVTSIGTHAFYNCDDLISVTIPSSVTNIGEGAFYGCKALDSVVIPDSVTSIGERAFYGAGLSSVSVGRGVTNISYLAFANCARLSAIDVDTNNPVYASEDGVLFTHDKTKLLCFPAYKEGDYTIPNKVENIGMYAFFNCDSLTSVALSDSVTNIESYAFYECNVLNSVTIPDGVTSIGANAFYGTPMSSVSIGRGVTSISSLAFAQCLRLKTINVDSNNLTYASEDGVLWARDKKMLLCCPACKAGEYTVPPGVTSIGERAFYGCKSLTSVTIPGTVTNIGAYAFYSCAALNSVTIPDSVASIGRNAFYGTSVSSATIGRGVTNLPPDAFDRCVQLKRIDVDINNPVYTSDDGVLFTHGKTTLLSFPASRGGEYVIPDGVTGIGAHAFDNCDHLVTVTIAGSVTNIGDYAFYCCDSLTSVTIPDSVAGIGYYAFYGTPLTSVKLGRGVASISPHAFQHCQRLDAINVDAENPLFASGDGVLFSNAQNTLVCCPGGKKGIYLIPDGITRIGKHAFCDCGSLITVAIPDSVTGIEDGAFLGCHLLETLYVPMSWRGTAILEKAGIPAECKIIYGTPGGPEEEATTSSPVAVPHSWLETNASDILERCGRDYEAAAMASAANGLNVWQCYLTGLGTTDPSARFLASIAFSNGVPVMTWKPDLGADRQYTVQGVKHLGDEWSTTNATTRFFRIKVGMPKLAGQGEGP